MKTPYLFKRDSEDLADSEHLERETLRLKLQKLVERAPFNATGIKLDTLRELLFDPGAFDA